MKNLFALKSIFTAVAITVSSLSFAGVDTQTDSNDVILAVRTTAMHLTAILKNTHRLMVGTAPSVQPLVKSLKSMARRLKLSMANFT